MNKEIADKIDRYLDYTLELQKNLTALPALAPDFGGDGEYEKAAYLERELKKLKFDEITKIDAPDKRVKSGIRPNIIARYKGNGNGKTLWIMSHLDIVPAGDRSLWKTDPYKMQKDGGKIYGRGVEDNQQGLTASILAVKALMELGIRSKVDIALFFNADEEPGSEYGVQYVLKNRPELFSKEDIFLTPDGGNSDGTLVQIAEKSLIWLKFTVTGKQCHGSMPQDGINAAKTASELICMLDEKLYSKFNNSDKLFTPPISTFEVTKREGNGCSTNTIPGKDTFYMDMRVIPEYKTKEILDFVKLIVTEIEQKRKVKVDTNIELLDDAAPVTSADAEITQLTLNAVKDVYGTQAKPQGVGGTSVATYTRRAGFPTIVYSKLDHMAHMPNEYCILDNLINDAKVMAHIALNAE